MVNMSDRTWLDYCAVHQVTSGQDAPPGGCRADWTWLAAAHHDTSVQDSPKGRMATAVAQPAQHSGTAGQIKQPTEPSVRRHSGSDTCSRVWGTAAHCPIPNSCGISSKEFHPIHLIYYKYRISSKAFHPIHTGPTHNSYGSRSSGLSFNPHRSGLNQPTPVWLHPAHTSLASSHPYGLIHNSYRISSSGFQPIQTYTGTIHKNSRVTDASLPSFPCRSERGLQITGFTTPGTPLYCLC